MRTLQIGILLGLLAFATHVAAAPSSAWVVSWATSVQSGAAYPTKPMVNLDNQDGASTYTDDATVIVMKFD